MNSVSDEKFNELSTEIAKCQRVNNSRYDATGDFSRIRKKLYSQNKLDFINLSDTLYVMEGVTTSDILATKIWIPSQQSVECVYNRYKKEQFFLDKENSVFTPYICSLVEMWDKNRLQIESEKNVIMGGFTIYATRIIIKNKEEYLVDCIQFEELSSPKEYRK